MSKPNVRSFRYSDEVKLILEQHNNDFDSLVVEAYLRLPAVEEQSKCIADYNEKLLKERNELLNQIRALKVIKQRLRDIEISFDKLEQNLKEL